MSEDIRIRVIQENQGDALKQAAADADALAKKVREEKLASHFQKHQGLDKEAATTKARQAIIYQDEMRAQKAAHREQVTSAKQAAKEKTDAEKQAAQEKVKAQQEVAQAQNSASKKAQQVRDFGLDQKEVEAAELRAAGRKKEADALEKHVNIQRRSAELQRQYGLSQAEAMRHAEREHVLAKAREGHRGHGGLMGMARTGGEIGDALGGQGMVMRSMQAARIGGMIAEGGPIAWIAAAAVATIGAHFVARGLKDADHSKDQALADKLREETSATERERAHRAAFGGAAESAAKVREAEDQAKAIDQHMKTRFHEVHDSPMARFLRTVTFGHSDKWREEGIGGHKSAYACEREEAEKEKARLTKDADADKKLAAEQFAKVESPNLQATRLRNAGQTEEAEQKEIDAKVEDERRRLATYNLSKDQIDQLLVRKRKELEGAGNYQQWLRMGGAEDIEASNFRAQGKTFEAAQIEEAARRQKDYEEIRHQMGGATPSPEIDEKARAAADAKARERAQANYADWSQHGGREMLDALEARNRGDIRGARAVEDRVDWMRRFREMSLQLDPTGKGMHDGEASEQASAEDFARKRERAGSFARTIDARTGADAAARVAAMAASVMGQHVAGGSGVHAELKAMHATMQSSLRISDAAWRAKFSRREHH